MLRTSEFTSEGFEELGFRGLRADGLGGILYYNQN